MAGEFVATNGDVINIPDLFNGIFLKGRREPRIAMVGRSNVGKSSLINALIGTRLAQTSNQPGKTRAIHFYYWKEAKKIIADLPGYGYARTAKDERDRWARFINAYFDEDEGLERALVLLDARHGPTDLDLDAIKFLSTQRVEITFVFTKSDSLKTQAERAKRRKEASSILTRLGYNFKNASWVSAKTKDGLHELTRQLSETPEGKG